VFGGYSVEKGFINTIEKINLYTFVVESIKCYDFENLKYKFYDYPMLVIWLSFLLYFNKFLLNNLIKSFENNVF